MYVFMCVSMSPFSFPPLTDLLYPPPPHKPPLQQKATARAKEMIAAAQFYYVASFFLTVSVESLLEVAEHAAEHNKVGGVIYYVCICMYEVMCMYGGGW